MMTNTNKSAADVLKISYEIINLVRQNYYYMAPANLVNNMVRPLITQAIQSETAALLASSVRLTAEVARLKAASSIVLESLQAANPNEHHDNWASPHIEGECDSCFYDSLEKCLAESISQPSPTGFGDKALKILEAAVRRDKISARALRASMDHGPESDCEAFYKADDDLNWAISELTPEEIKLLEGYGDEN